MYDFLSHHLTLGRAYKRILYTRRFLAAPNAKKKGYNTQAE